MNRDFDMQFLWKVLRSKTCEGATNTLEESGKIKLLT